MATEQKGAKVKLTSGLGPYKKTEVTEDRNMSREQDTDRIQPSSIDTERAILGAMLLDKEAISKAITILDTDCFYRDAHSKIFFAIVALFERNEPADDRTIVEELRKHKELEAIGGASYLAELATEVATAKNVEYHARIVLEKAKRRKAIALAEQIQIAAYREDQDVDELLASGIEQLSFLRQMGIESKQRWTADDLIEVLPSIEWLWNPWIPKGMVTLLVGDPKVGKSRIALSLAAAVIRGDAWPDGTVSHFEDRESYVLWVDTEATQALLAQWIQEWDLPGKRIKLPMTGDLLDNVRLDEPKGWNAVQAEIASGSPELVIVDSLKGAHGGDENAAETGNLVQRLGGLARDYNTAIVVIHHLRKRSAMDGKEVTQDRIRGSSAIYQFARSVLAVDRPDPNDPETGRLQVIASNLAIQPPPVGFQTSDNGVTWLPEAPRVPKPETQLDRAKDMLLAWLRKAPMQTTEIEDKAKVEGISMATMRNAKKLLHIVAVKKGDGKWYWSLRAKEEPK